MPNAAAIYVRISKDPSGTHLGVQRQEQDCRAVAERKGWSVAEVYVDNDFSASSGRRRPAYERMLDAIKQNAVDAVVVWDLDRLVRRPIELEQFFAVADAAGLRHLASVGGDVDLATGEGLMVARIKGAVAAEEVRKMSARLRRKHLELAQAGKVSGGGTRPFGYEADRMTIRESEAELIREAVQRFFDGESVYHIAEDWNARSIPTVSGGPWRRTVLSALLCSARISGRREHPGVSLGPAAWPAIIDPDTSDRLRARRAVAPGRNGGQRYLLSGLLRCGLCEHRMVGQPHHSGLHRFRCDVACGGCGRLGIATKALEDVVAIAIFTKADQPSTRDALAKERGAQVSAVDDLVAEAALAQAALDELAQDYYVERAIGRSDFFAARGPLQLRLDDARRRLARGERPQEASFWIGRGEDLRQQWETMSLVRRQAIVRGFVDSIMIRPSEMRHAFDPDRVEITWRW